MEYNKYFTENPSRNQLFLTFNIVVLNPTYSGS